MDVEMRKVKFSEYFKNRIKDIPFAVMCALYMAFCVGCMIYSAVELGARDALLAVVYMIFIPAVFVFEYLIGFRVGYILTVLIIFSACGGLLGSSYNIYKLAFAIFFSTTVGVAWEFFEYLISETMGFDMLEDAMVTDIQSYLLSQSHNVAVELNDITQTVITYDGGKEWVINGGYMDLGLYDTLNDLLIAAAGTVSIAIVSIISFYKFPKFNKMFIPELVNNRRKPIEATASAADTADTAETVDDGVAKESDSVSDNVSDTVKDND